MADRRTITRRQFTAAAAASAFAFTYIPSRVFGANERLLVAGIGVGGKGAGEVSDISNAGGTFVALCDVDTKRASGTFKKHPDAKFYTDFRVMLEKEKGIDAVTVSTPDHMHAPAAVLAMQMGKHVYCQKPLTHSVYEARVMMETARKYKVATQMGNQAHAGEPIRRAVELIRAGIIGNVKEVHCWTNRPIWPQGMKDRPAKEAVPDSLDWNQWLGPAPWREYNHAYLPFNWRGWWDFGTGALGDMACHIMDMPFWALDLAHPTSVEAQQQGNTEESAPNWSIVTWQFPKRTTTWGGEQPEVKYCWYDGKKDGKPNLPPEELVADAGVPRAQLTKFDGILIGDKGKMVFNRGNTNWVVTPGDRVAALGEVTKTIRRVPNEDVEWVEACKGGAPALSNFDYSGLLTETVLLGNVAIRAGRRIEWDAANLKVTNEADAQRFIQRPYREGWTLGMPKV